MQIILQLVLSQAVIGKKGEVKTIFDGEDNNNYINNQN